MKPFHPILFTAALLTQLPAEPTNPPVVVVEETVVQPAVPAEVTTEKVVIETVVEATPADLQRLDAATARRQLSTAPRPIAVEKLAPGTKVETTETVDTIQYPGQPARVYNVQRSVVIVEGRELPYLTIPVLFVKETADLLDVESRDALDDTAAAIREIITTDSSAVFDIEGHTSTDGTAEMNLDLSAKRARRVYEELTKHYKIPASALSAHGYGETFPAYPNGNEAQMTYDRRVLVVRVK